MQFHQYSHEELFSLTKSSLQGLNESQVSDRQRAHGFNQLEESGTKSWWLMLFEQFVDFMILVLIAAAAISWFLGDQVDAYVILGIVLMNAIVGFYQEFQAEKAMDALRRMSAPSARVIREGQQKDVPAKELVVGDIIVIEAGNIVPADARLIDGASVRVEEAALTGESHAVDKVPSSLQEEYLPLGDRTNMLFKGTAISHGSGRALVVAIAMQTELGKIASLLQEDSNLRTPLQQRLAEFGRRLAVAVLIICAIVFGFGLWRGEDAMVMLLTAISLAVAAIPEALPAVVTVALSMSAKKMVQRHALIRKLPAVETLGSVSFICTDKTGTLTQQRMSVRRILMSSDSTTVDEFRSEISTNATAKVLGDAMCLSNDVIENEDGSLLGESTEQALFRAAHELGWERSQRELEFPRMRSLPFDSERKCMSTIHQLPSGSFRVFVKGAPELLIEKCVQDVHGGVIGGAERERVLHECQSLAVEGLRVLAFATRELAADQLHIADQEVESSLQYLGCVGLIDPPRPEVRDAVQRCREAQITPVMITGDHPLTALAIAEELGIAEKNDATVLTSRDLEKMSDADLQNVVLKTRVYARVAPDQKLRIVRALQAKGQYVAMTGDGVNDAPALKMANIGVAMGINGTEVSKEASAMILLDDNFATIVNAVEEGRRVYDNIRKFIKYIMTSNSGEIWTIFLAPFLGLPIPLLPVHILWINLVTDGLPGIALAAEPATKNIMKRGPRPPSESIFAHGMGMHILWVGLLMGIVPLITQALAIHWHDSHWQTMVFTVLCLSQMGHVLAIRSDTESVFRIGLFSNRSLIAAIFVTLVLQMMTIYVPAAQSIFHTEALSMTELALAIAAASVVFFAVEIEKWLRRRSVKNKG